MKKHYKAVQTVSILSNKRFLLYFNHPSCLHHLDLNANSENVLKSKCNVMGDVTIHKILN